METDHDQSEFNMAVSYLNRLNWLFYKADEAAMMLNAFSWFHSLMTLYRELSTELTLEEIKEWEGSRTDSKDGKVDKLNIDVYTNCRNSKGMKIDSDLYMQLHNFDIFLRGILKRAGLLTKLKEKLDLSGL